MKFKVGDTIIYKGMTDNEVFRTNKEYKIVAIDKNGIYTTDEKNLEGDLIHALPTYTVESFFILKPIKRIKQVNLP